MAGTLFSGSSVSSAARGSQNRVRRHAENIGDAYTYIAFERNTKLVLAWHLGKLDTPNTVAFIRKLRAATFQDPFELCTDAFGSYVPAIREVL